jgi:hypothetical protein
MEGAVDSRVAGCRHDDATAPGRGSGLDVSPPGAGRRSPIE